MTSACWRQSERSAWCLRATCGSPIRRRRRGRLGTSSAFAIFGLVQTDPYVVGRTRTTLVTLTGDGRDVLEAGRRPGAGGDRQAFYVGITKPRELAHDSRVYSAYMKAAERLAERGEPVRRVVLEEELKREYQRFLQAQNRERRERGETPEGRAEAVARWAQEHELPVRRRARAVPGCADRVRGP